MMISIRAVNVEQHLGYKQYLDFFFLVLIMTMRC